MNLIESEILELKKSTSELKEAIISIVAILNKHSSGDIYFGIKNDGQILGQSVTEKTIRDVSKTISDNIEPKIFPVITKEVIKEKSCIRIQFNGADGPYYAYGRSYLRIADEDKKISSKELEKLFLNKNKFNNLWDKRKSHKKISDVNVQTLKQFFSKANEAQRINFKFINTKKALKKLNLLEGEYLTNAGELLFCDNNNLEFQMATFAGIDKFKFLDIKSAEGNIFTLINAVEFYLKNVIKWEVKFGKMKRDEIPELPIAAVREALINSLCHRDYTNPKSNELAIFKDRIEIYNPGPFPEGLKPSDYINNSERSILRNTSIAKTLFLSRDIEKWGSGIKRIHDLCKTKKIKVKFKILKTGFLVIFYRRDTTPIKANQIMNYILQALSQKPMITRIEILAFLKTKKIIITLNGLKYHLEQMVKKKVIIRVGNNRIDHWEIIK